MDVVYTQPYPERSQVLVGAVLYLVSVFGTVGNIVLILALRKNARLKNVSNLLTISLAASDVLIAAIAMPISGYAALNLNSKEAAPSTHVSNHTPECKYSDQSVRLTPFLCTLNGLVIYVSSRVSTWTLAGMAIERYIAVLHPLKYNRMVTKKRMVVTIIIIWTVSVIVELPQVAGWFPFVYYHNAFGCLSPSYHHMGYKHQDFLIFSISKKVLLTLLPTPLIGFCYYRILGISFKNKHMDVLLDQKYKDPTHHKHKFSSGTSVTNTKLSRRLTAHESIGVMLKQTSEKYNYYKKSFIWLVIVISYVICWSPVSVTGITMNFLDAYCEKYYFRGLIISTFVIAIMNSCVNPVIYGLLHQQIRRTFIDILRCRSTSTRLRGEQQQEYLANEGQGLHKTPRTASIKPPLPSQHKTILSNPLTMHQNGRTSNDHAVVNKTGDKLNPPEKGETACDGNTKSFKESNEDPLGDFQNGVYRKRSVRFRSKT